MSDTLNITGQVTITPNAATDAELSGDFGIKIPLTQTAQLAAKQSMLVTIAPSVTFSVPLGSVAPAINFLTVHTSGPAYVIVPNIVYGTQRLPVDGLLLFEASTAPGSLSIENIDTADITASITIGRYE